MWENEYLYTSILAYGIDIYISCDNLVAVIGVVDKMSQLGT